MQRLQSITLSALGGRLWRLIQTRPATYSIGELTVELGASKTAINKAIAELHEHGIIEVEDV